MISFFYIYTFIKAFIAHLKYNIEDSILKVNDIVQFFVVIEIVTFMSSFFVVMIFLFFSSCINEKNLNSISQRN